MSFTNKIPKWVGTFWKDPLLATRGRAPAGALPKFSMTDDWWTTISILIWLMTFLWIIYSTDQGLSPEELYHFTNKIPKWVGTFWKVPLLATRGRAPAGLLPKFSMTQIFNDCWKFWFPLRGYFGQMSKIAPPIFLGGDILDTAIGLRNKCQSYSNNV